MNKFLVSLIVLTFCSSVYADDRRLLLHMNGADTSTTFVDDSGQGHTTSSVNATCELDTAVKQWGSASVLHDGASGDFIYADNSDWDIFQQTNFTIDLWVKHDDHVGEEVYLQQQDGSGFNWAFWHRHSVGLRLSIWDGTSPLTLDGGEIEDTNQHHIAVIKVGDDYGTYLDGSQVGYGTASITLNLTASLYGGSWGNINRFFDGHMDEIRINFDNIFGAAPVVGLSDTIDVPDEETPEEVTVGQVIFIN